MFRNGIYKISYGPFSTDKDVDLQFCEHALAVMREGKLIGADRHGAVFIGEPVQSTGERETIRVQLTVPPGGELVNGYCAGPNGALLSLRGQFDPTRDDQTSTVELAGIEIALRVRYLGPLPE